MKNTPLGLPTGTVRAIIALAAVLFALIYGGFCMYAKFIKGTDIELPSYILATLGTTTGYYFGYRTDSNPVDKAGITKKPDVEIPTPEQYIPPQGIAEPDETNAG